MYFRVDNVLAQWSERPVGGTTETRYSRETGYEYVDNGEVIDYMSGLNNWPRLVKMLKPRSFGIWGRPDDTWRMKGAEAVEHGYLMHLDRDDAPAVAELFIDTTFSLPVRWTETNQVRPDFGSKIEVDILGLHIPVEWKLRTGMDMSEEGEYMVFWSNSPE